MRDNLKAITAAGILGWMNIHELVWLSRTAQRQEPGAWWVEIGVNRGRSFTCVGLSLPDTCTLVGVDITDEMLAPAKRIRDERPGLNVMTLWCDSVAAADCFKDGSLSLIFIDGGHDQPQVEADIMAWRPKLAPGGILSGHDAIEPGVWPALEAQGIKWSNPAGSIWVAD